jgi:hypothetical protein
MKRLINWLANKISARKPTPAPDLRQTGTHLRQSGAHRVPRRQPHGPTIPARQPEFVEVDPQVKGRIEDLGPGKNVLIRNKYVREDTGTHETLKILDDSVLEMDEETGIDPYNTGQFDRSKQWDKRFRG